MTFSGKIKTIDNKNEQNKAQYHLDSQTAKVSALPSGNVSKDEFLADEDLLPEKRILEKPTKMKRFTNYSPLGNELKYQTSIAEKQYQELDKVCRYDRKVVIKKKRVHIWLIKILILTVVIKKKKVQIWLIKILILTNSVLVRKSLTSFLKTQ